MEEEIWKPVIGYEDLYEVSNLGRVKSIGKKDVRGHLRREKILKPRRTTCGYLQVVLYKDGKMKNKLVHRLVAEAFIPNDVPLFKTDINHKDENILNNMASNLEWCTRKYNLNYGTRNKRAAKAKSKPVLQYSLDGSLIAGYPSTMEVKRQLGFSQGDISKCCNGKRKTVHGYIWRYSYRNKQSE